MDHFWLSDAQGAVIEPHGSAAQLNAAAEDLGIAR